MRGAVAADQDLDAFPHFMEAKELKQELVTPAAAATHVSAHADWQRPPAGQQHSYGAAANPACDPTPKLDLSGRTPGSEQGDMNLADEDLLDIATMFNDEEEQLLEL